MQSFFSIVLAALFLASCGGGSGSSEEQPTVDVYIRAPQIFNFNGTVDIIIPDSPVLVSAQDLMLHVEGGGGNSIYSVPGNRELKNIPDVEGASYYYSYSVGNVIYKSSVYKNIKNKPIVYSWGALSFITNSVTGLSVPFNWDPELGLEISDESQGLGALRSNGRIFRDVRFADFDNDGLMDVIANTYTENQNEGTLLLFWGNRQGGFDLDIQFSLQNFTGYGETLVVADLNNDGYLEIFVPQYDHAGVDSRFRNLLFTFSPARVYREIGYEAGVALTNKANPEGAQALDFNQDGLIDLYAGGALLLNNGNLRFSDITDSVGLPGRFDEGAKFFDYDNDGDLDFVYMALGQGALIYINNNSTYSLAPTGVAPTVQALPEEFFNASYGLNTGDYNFDGYDDIFVAGGLDSNGQLMPPRLFLNYKGVFRKVNIIPNVPNAWSDLVSFGDVDGDGSLDLFYRYGGRNILLNSNRPYKTISIDVRLNGRPNQYGRMVKIYYPDGIVKASVVDGGSGYMSVQPYMVHIPNDAGSSLKIEVYCSNKILTKYAAESVIRFDCD